MVNFPECARRLDYNTPPRVGHTGDPSMHTDLLRTATSRATSSSISEAALRTRADAGRRWRSSRTSGFLDGRAQAGVDVRVAARDSEGPRDRIHAWPFPSCRGRIPA